MTSWNPWRGCHRISEGCRNCYIHSGDKRRGIDTNQITKSKQFDRIIRKNKQGEYLVAGGQTVYVCFNSDFLLEEADTWRHEVWAMMRQRSDLDFLFLTKRIHRFAECIPDDWGDGYDNVHVGCSVENQQVADKRLPYLVSLPLKHRIIICQPLIGAINLSPYLSDKIDDVVVGGEAGKAARLLDYQWVLDIRNQCLQANVPFTFRQVGSKFMMNQKHYNIPWKLLSTQARKANINTRRKT